MKAIDMQAMMSTERGQGVKDPVLLKEMLDYFRAPKQVFKTEKEMINDFREAGVKVVICMPNVPLFGWKDMGEIKEFHDYVGHLIKSYPEAILGAWVNLDPCTGRKGLLELERCIKDLGTFGIGAVGSTIGIPVNDRQWYPFYELCNEAKVPVKLWVGATGGGAGQPGGRGIHLWFDNPIPYVDDVAADFPELTIICAHCPWPFHHEMIAVLVHKGNVYNEVHGWSPKYFPGRLKQEINGRIQDKVMFGSDYPWFTYQRLFKEWEAEGYKPEVLEKVYWKNAARVLGINVQG